MPEKFGARSCSWVNLGEAVSRRGSITESRESSGIKEFESILCQDSSRPEEYFKTHSAVFWRKVVPKVILRYGGLKVFFSLDPEKGPKEGS